MKKSLGAHALAFPAPVWVIGTYDEDGKPNVMTAAWVGICSSKPPCVAASVQNNRFSHGNIVDRQAFTISVPSEHHVKTVDHWGMVSGRKEDKLARAGLTSIASDIVYAPVANYGLRRTNEV